jgi:uncharacterized membrane protein YraQ (UPF0718 family)
MNTIFWSFVLRFGQAAIEASLTLLIGVIVAGVLRRMVGPSGTRRLFGRGWVGLFRGWLAGMLLPVCSLGVIPVAREMRRTGVPGGTVLAFVLAAPLLNPISFLYGLTLAEPFVICCFAAASLVLSTLAGLLWDRVFARTTDTAEAAELARLADAEPSPAEGPRRVLSVVVTAGRELTGRDLVFYATGLFGSALLSTLIPYGSLQHTMQHSDPSSPALMAAIAVPLYTSPITGMMKIGLMFEHGNSIGAAFVLFALGIGTSLGTLAWLVIDFGWRRVVPWFLTYIAIVLAMAYLSEPLLFDSRKAAEDHTHAFDDYSAPFVSASETGAVSHVEQKLNEKWGPLEQPVTYAIGGLVVVGLIVRRLNRHGRLEAWLTARHAETGRARPKWDVTIPGPTLGAMAFIGLVVFSVIGAYVYYPDRDQSFGQMVGVYTEAVVATRTGHKDEAIRRLEQCDDITRKLEVGTYIRSFAVTPEQKSAGEEFREAIEEVRDELIANNLEGAKQRLVELQVRYRALRGAYPRTGGEQP